MMASYTLLAISMVVGILVLFVDMMQFGIATYVGETLECRREYGNTHDLYTVAML